MTRHRVITVMLVVFLCLTVTAQVVTISAHAPIYIILVGTALLCGEALLLYLHLRWRSPIVAPLLCALIILATVIGETPSFAQNHVQITIFVPAVVAAVLLAPWWVLITFAITIVAFALRLCLLTGRWEWATLGPTYSPANLVVSLILVVSVTVASWVRHQALVQLEATNRDLERQVQDRTKALAAALQVAENANEMKSKFLANMSHELRTPLNSIINFTELVLTKVRLGSLTEPQRERLERVLANGEHLLALINDILDLAKIEAGQLDVRFQSVDLLPLLRSSMSTAAGLTKGKPIDLDLIIELPEGARLPLVRIDPTRIRQVILNLLSNAAKFTEQGSITIRAGLTDTGFVQIAVADTGIGIAPEHQALVFEEFRQVDGELNRVQQGTGLGLAITRRLIELHGGTLWLESTPGAGSTFAFTLPVVSEPAEPSVDAATPAPEQPLAASMPLIVVVDDDPDAHRIIRDSLCEDGYRVHAVLDSREALATIQQLQPCLVILDVQMPVLDGWEVLAQVRTTPATAAIPVLMFTIIENQRLGIALGATDYLVKPVPSEVLIAAVRRCLPSPATVLIIDDDPDARAIVRTVLDGEHYHLIDAASGSDGLAALRAQQVDLIILDLMMPEMDGFEVLTEIDRNPSLGKPPVIVVTAKDLTAEERHWLQERTLLCIQKSQLSPQEFRALIRDKMVVLA